MAAKAVLSLKVTLIGTKPPIWRRLRVPGIMTLADLHDAIQAAMGWQDCHLHLFVIDGRQYGDPSTTDDVLSEKRLTLNAVVKSGVRNFIYAYDFGDDWTHKIAIEKVELSEDDNAEAKCVAGKRACPPEDCGGVWGYEELLEAMKDPNNPEHSDILEWVDDDFDPEAFTVEMANAAIRAQRAIKSER